MSAFVFRRRDEPWCTEPVHGEEVKVTFRRPRMSDWTDLLNSLPHFLGGASQEEGEHRRVGVPKSEIRLMLDFLHEHTLSIAGVEDAKGQPVLWESLTPDERDHFWEMLPASAPANFVLAFLGRIHSEDRFAQDLRAAKQALATLEEEE